MARYSVIMRDKTYMKLLEYGARNGKTLGKLINEILDNFVKKEQNADGHLAASPVCIVCGARATFEAHGKGQQRLYVCGVHKGLSKQLDGYRNL